MYGPTGKKRKRIYILSQLYIYNHFMLNSHAGRIGSPLGSSNDIKSISSAQEIALKHIPNEPEILVNRGLMHETLTNT